MPVTADQVLPVVRVGEIKSEENAQRWLVEGLWGASSVGVIGGAPKCAKTWLGLDMASERGHGHGVPGQVCRAAAGSGPGLPGRGCTASGAGSHRGHGPASRSRSRRSRHPRDHRAQPSGSIASGTALRLLETTRRLRPRLLLLDPLVRLHGIDENNAGEVAELLAYFRSLQRQLDLSVLLVHHTRKNAAGGVAAGQGLRGSGDIHAFGDSNLYLRRTREHLVLSSEHRAAPASPPVYLDLVATNAETTHLEVVGELRDGSTKLTRDGKQRCLEEQVARPSGPGRGA